MLENRYIQVFVAVFKTRSFSKAAQQLYITQPTVSGHIKTLEDVLGVILFDRTGKSVIPTKAAMVLFPFASQIVSLTSQAIKELSLFRDQQKGSIEIGGSTIPGQYILPRLMGHFKATRPGIHIVIKIGDSADITAKVMTGEIELGVVGAFQEQRWLAGQECFMDELVFVTPKGHPLADRESVTLHDILETDVAFVIREMGSGTRRIMESALKKAGLRRLEDLNVVAEMGSSEAVKQAVREGVGCSILSKRAVEEEIRNGSMASPQFSGVELARSFYLIWHEKRPLSPLAKSLKEFITASCEIK
ncbi:MAG: selenium metabolism-associated LysR family transcriptional regulator [Dissulfuribacterales bacterium]